MAKTAPTWRTMQILNSPNFQSSDHYKILKVMRTFARNQRIVMVTMLSRTAPKAKLRGNVPRSVNKELWKSYSLNRRTSTHAPYQTYKWAQMCQQGDLEIVYLQQEYQHTYPLPDLQMGWGVSIGRFGNRIHLAWVPVYISLTRRINEPRTVNWEIWKLYTFNRSTKIFTPYQTYKWTQECRQGTLEIVYLQQAYQHTYPLLDVQMSPGVSTGIFENRIFPKGVRVSCKTFV